MSRQAERSSAPTARRRWVDAHWLKPKSWAFSDDPDVLIGQYANLKRQVPLLYLLLVIIAAASVYLTADSAPRLIVGLVSGLFVAVCTTRMVWWLWFGGGLMMAGTLVAAWPSRKKTAVKVAPAATAAK